MTKIKLCGLTRPCDIAAANALMPDYIGFVFAEKSRRYVSPDRADELKSLLDTGIESVGVFVNERPEAVARLLNRGTIGLAQLHGDEDEYYISKLRTLTDKPIIKAFRICAEQDMPAAQSSSADFILLDSGTGGTGTAFDWNLALNLKRPFFLAGGLDPSSVRDALKMLHPYAVDVSSGVETSGLKDQIKMADFVHSVRGTVRKEYEQ